MMKFLNVTLLIVLAALAIFAVLNWAAIVTPIPLSLLFTDANAPLGLILLAATGLLTLFFLGFVVYMQSSTLMIRKRLNRELEEQRKLADNAEASRFTELRNFLEVELQKQIAQTSEVHQKIESKLVEIEVSMKNKMEETGTSLSAYIGELEDRLEKK
jgi:uncharacterized integral membrane protein